MYKNDYKRWLSEGSLNSGFSKLKETLSKLFEAVKPQPRITPYAWADLYRYINKGRIKGKWHSNVSPYLLGLAEDFIDDDVETIVAMFSVQLGKSAFLESVIGYLIHQSPCPIYMVLPDEKSIDDFKQDKLEDMFESSKIFYESGLIKRTTPGSSDTNSRKIRYRNGYIAFASSNSMSSLAGRSVKILLLDEIDRFKLSKNEGDVVLLAKNRTSSFAGAGRKIVLTSTPAGDTEFSRINKAYLSGDQRKYFIKCPHCSHEQTLLWSNIEWEKEKTPDGKYTHDADTAYYRCDAGGCRIENSQKHKFLNSGRWVATAKPRDKSIHSYHLNILYSPFVSFADVVREYLDSKETPGGMRTFFNTQLAEVYEDPAEQAQYEEIYERAEDYTSALLPKEIGFLTLGADVQERGDGRLEASVWGWGRNNQRWLVEHHVIDGSYKNQETWDSFTNVRHKRYTTEDGRELSILMSLVDSSAGNTTNYVYEYCRKYRNDRVRPVKGSNRQDSGILETTKLENDSNGKRLKNSILLTRPNVHQFKTWLYSALQDIKAKDEAYYIHTTKEAGKNWHRQLCAEKLVKDVGKEQWVKTYANEALDCAIYAHSAAHLIGINSVDWDSYFKKVYKDSGITEEIQEKQEDEYVNFVQVEVLKPLEIDKKWHKPGDIIDISEEKAASLCDGPTQFAHRTSEPPRQKVKEVPQLQKKKKRLVVPPKKKWV